MKKVNNLEDARSFFLSNSVGSITCVKDSKELVCNSFPAAKAFFENRRKKLIKNIQKEQDVISRYGRGADIESILSRNLGADLARDLLS